MPELTVNGIGLYYEIHGRGEPVVFLHGLGSSTLDWALQKDAFWETHRVITVDIRGHGQSAKPAGPYSIQQFSEDILALVLKLELAPCHLVGISMGAMIAVQLALDHPENVLSVVAVNSPPDMRPRSIKERAMVIQRKCLVNLFGMEKVGKVLAARLFPSAEHAQVRETFAERWAKNDITAYRASLNAILDWTVAERLEEFKSRLLIIAASEDYLPLASKEIYIKKVPGAELVVVENSRHATPVEMPDKFNQILCEWLQR